MSLYQVTKRPKYNIPTGMINAYTNRVYNYDQILKQGRNNFFILHDYLLYRYILLGVIESNTDHIRKGVNYNWNGMKHGWDSFSDTLKRQLEKHSFRNFGTIRKLEMFK